jgi:shikimate kinase
MNLLLMGMRASGKTTVGKLLADRLAWPFIDLDQRVLGQFTQDTVREIWAAHGERAWRESEASELAQVLRYDGQVVALGGGVPMFPASRRLLDEAKSSGSARVVYLQCSVPELQRRLTNEPGDRPSLTKTSGPQSIVEEIGPVLAQREATYLALADLVCDSDAAAPEDLAAIIAKTVR